MKNKILILVLLFLISIGQYKNASFAKNNIDLFNGIVDLTNASTMEYGIRASFENDSDGEDYCLELLKKLQFNEGEVNVVKNDNIYSLEFNNNEIKGYIENISYDNHNVVTISVSENSEENKLTELKNKIQNAIERSDKEVKYFQYLKAQINSNNTAEINEEIISFLKNQNAVNIDTVKLDNGYSTVAYTKRYPIMKNNGKWMDFNYAVCTYSSGSYITIGTPVIISSY